MTYYGILGLDPIAQNAEDLEFDMAKEEQAAGLNTKKVDAEEATKSSQGYQIKAKYGLEDHAFGLDHQLFTTKHEFE